MRGRSEAQRLDGAEHRCSLAVVMADGVDVTPNVITSPRPQVDVECSARVTIFRDSNWPAKHART
jgi:hypothetical protein